MKKIKIYASLAFALISGAASAQFSVGVSSGIYNLTDNLENVTYNKPFGYALRAQYVYNFGKKWGVGTGLEYATYKQNTRVLEDQEITTLLVDNTGSAFEYRVKTTNYKEKQNLSTLQIPLFLQFSQPISEKAKFILKGGVKYVVPMQFDIEAGSDFVQASGYYPDVNLLITDLPDYGFGAQNNYASKGEYETKSFLMHSFEVGFGFKFTKKTYLYTTMFLDHAFSSIIENIENQSFIGYTPNGIDNRPANGLYSQGTDTSVKPRVVGLSLNLSFE
jgi:hypothetical protein